MRSGAAADDAVGRSFVWVHDPLALASDQDYLQSTAPGSFLAALSGFFVLSRFSWPPAPRPRPAAMQRATRRPAGASRGARYSASQFAEAARPWLRRTANGIPPHLLRDGRNERHRLLYASWPSSGLEELLSVFPHIRRQVQLRPAPRRDCDAPHHAPSAAHRALGWASQVPRVELHVYGGFDWWCAPRADEAVLTPPRPCT
jgi:hypothetical protein